jgi:dTDP-glucose 4,6-dehydratase
MDKPVTSVVTGGAGFIGSHVVERLLGLGHRVVCMDNLLTGSRRNIEDFEKQETFVFDEGDVTEYMMVDGDVDYVFHLASPASPSDYLRYPIRTLKVGSLGTHNALGLAKVKNAVFFLASTSEVYGDPLVSPQTEEYWGNVNPVGPRGVYDEAKRYAEALTLAYHRKHNIQVRIARIFNTFGPGMRLDDGRAIPNFMSQALRNQDITVFGTGEQTRSFCYIDDMVDGLLKLVFSDLNEPTNIGNPEEIPVRQLAEEIIEITDSRSNITYHPLPENDPKVRCPDISKAERVLGFAPKTSRRDGLTRTADYFRKMLASAENNSSSR